MSSEALIKALMVLFSLLFRLSQCCVCQVYEVHALELAFN